MRRVFIFRNRGTAEVKNVVADDSGEQKGLDWAIRYCLEVAGWNVTELEFQGSRQADRTMDLG